MWKIVLNNWTCKRFCLKFQIHSFIMTFQFKIISFLKAWLNCFGDENNGCMIDIKSYRSIKIIFNIHRNLKTIISLQTFRIESLEQFSINVGSNYFKLKCLTRAVSLSTTYKLSLSTKNTFVSNNTKLCNYYMPNIF